MSGPGLVADGLVVRFGGLVAVDGVSLEAPAGRITALIGPNGAGKTTTFDVCSGFLRPDQGTVTFDGVDVTRVGAARRARLGLGRTFQRLELWSTLSVRRNVELAAESLHIGDNPLSQLGLAGRSRRIRRQAWEQADELLDLVGLTELADRPAGTLSTGQGRLLELARALARRPRLLLLDEPSSGLDVAETEGFGRLLRQVVAEGIPGGQVQLPSLGILLVEHDMDLVLGISQWIYVLNYGRPLLDGTPETVMASDTVRQAYLGSLASASAGPS
jgi:ABC-type branched-subunit amino acid transport system ATPase component